MQVSSHHDWPISLLLYAGFFPIKFSVLSTFFACLAATPSGPAITASKSSVSPDSPSSHEMEVAMTEGNTAQLKKH